MINELDTVVLNRDIEEYGLKTGDIGAVVHSYSDKLAFEVEFVNGEGETVAVLTLSSQRYPSNVQQGNSACKRNVVGIGSNDELEEQLNRPMRSVTKRLNGEGFLVTTYPTDVIKEGERIWSR